MISEGFDLSGGKVFRNSILRGFFAVEEDLEQKFVNVGFYIRSKTVERLTKVRRITLDFRQLLYLYFCLGSISSLLSAA